MNAHTAPTHAPTCPRFGWADDPALAHHCTCPADAPNCSALGHTLSLDPTGVWVCDTDGTRHPLTDAHRDAIGACPDCGRRMGWDGHAYAACGVAR
jgi:hypothetical protein